MKQPFALLVLSILFAGCATEAADEPAAEEVGTTSEELKLRPLDVAFAGCSEVASVAPVPVAQARPAVPANLALAGDGTVAPFVVRIANCSSVRVDGGPSESGTVAQLGVGIVSPDGTGDINNYVAGYYTTSLRLALRLQLLGISAQWAPRLDYDLSGSTLDIDVRPPSRPAFHVTSQVVEPPSSTIPFVANWWEQRGSRLTKMSTPIPAIHFGSAQTTLTTAPRSPLASLLGAPQIASFPFLDSFNRFDAATMTVSRN